MSERLIERLEKESTRYTADSGKEFVVIPEQLYEELVRFLKDIHWPGYGSGKPSGASGIHPTSR